ncbi:MBL fold metallo-hydrolase [Dietzia psychralcaliphila]|uniref:MBL fold metallo-hydrolase n=1 Tax=Dietzia psychralcaliphila TaxID=139021 RepID=UPI001C1E7D0C|nr:MBL fold metallo-hydrolase [Dietzia psychralcaliphila]
MRLKWGRPDLAAYQTQPATSPASSASPLTVSFLGVTTLLFDDGESAVMTDGFFTRPSLARTLLTPLRSDPARIEYALRRAGVGTLDAVVCGHSHYDHALDSAAVAQRTGATLVGSESTAQLGRGAQLPPGRIVTVAPGDALTFGTFTLTFIESEHSHPDRITGVIDHAIAQPAPVREYRCGETWSILLDHAKSGRSALVHSSAGFRPGMLGGHRADVAYLAVGQLGHQPRDFIEQYWAETVTAVGAESVILTHWDDFFRPLTKPLRALPYAVDDLDAAIRVLTACAERDGVRLELPTLWRRTDPWATA